jgi:uncharacterized protein (TIGR01244 family)
MKKKIVLTLSFLVLFTIVNVAYSQETTTSNLHQVERIDGIPNFFKSHDFYFAGQPSAETFKSLKEDGLELVINLRSDAENAKQTQNSFNEEELVKSLGIKYASIPMSGASANCPETVEKIAQAIKSVEGKILIHCASCGRVTNVWMAYLIKHRDFSVDEAIAVGKQLKFKFYLEDLLGEEVTMDLKN